MSTLSTRSDVSLQTQAPPPGHHPSLTPQPRPLSSRGSITSFPRAFAPGAPVSGRAPPPEQWFSKSRGISAAYRWP